MKENFENKIEMAKDDEIQELIMETYYMMGQRQALLSQMRWIIREIGCPEDFTIEARIIEREEALIALRQKCLDAGKPSNFPDDLHLADIIQKYL